MMVSSKIRQKVVRYISIMYGYFSQNLCVFQPNILLESKSNHLAFNKLFRSCKQRVTLRIGEFHIPSTTSLKSGPMHKILLQPPCEHYWGLFEIHSWILGWDSTFLKSACSFGNFSTFMSTPMVFGNSIIL